MDGQIQQEISIQPELSSPPRFRIQGGWSERYGGLTVGRTEILVSNTGFFCQFVENVAKKNSLRIFYIVFS